MEEDTKPETSFPDSDPDVDERIIKRSRLLRRQVVQSKKFCAKDERIASLKKVSVILQKSVTDRTTEESQVLTECSEAVEEVQLRWRKRDEAKRRLEEFEEPFDVVREKCQVLAQAIAQSQHLVVYTGAGISTAAKIPDYRGPNGIWTRLQQGKDIGAHDLSLAEPTFTHMALAELYRRRILKYVVSQNCDGLHLRSGLPRIALSELHGNMYMEVCKNCKPHKEYWRLFDVTENTARYSHRTSRRCYQCSEALVDTIVHFGERGSLQWPLNWSGACKNAEQATTILCLGSSLKVLKKYPWLWRMDKPVKKRPNLYIVNLQWTPKDDVCNMKLHGRCDQVMQMVMKILDIDVPNYDKSRDPIFTHSTPLCELELHTTTQPCLKPNETKHDLSLVQNKDCLVKGDLTTTVKSESCDKSSNSILSNNHPENCLPIKDESPKSSAFSIDDILQNSVHSNKIATTVNDTRLFSGYSLLNCNTLASNLIQCQILGGYSNFLFYPFQTSFLYPGLHSIINPIQEYSFNDDKATVANIKVEPSCEFCDQMYESSSCLFYLKIEPVFIKPQYRFSKIEQKEKINPCICCDYSTDEDDIEMNENKEQNINNEKEQIKAKIQAGWFGKGYKKNRRLKKK